MMYDLATLKNSLIEYTHKKDFYDYQGVMESKIEKLAPWDSVRSLYNEFQRYVPNAEFDDYKKEVQQLFSEVYQILQSKQDAE